MFEITTDVSAWKTYLPLAEKKKIASEIASCCILQYKTEVEMNGEIMYEPVVCSEDVGARWRCMMGVLLYYTGVDFEPVEGRKWLMAQDDYDRAASRHPLNVLERMKASAAARDKVFDLLRDYKDVDRLVSAEISAQLAALNDLLPRTLSLLMQSVTPEAIQTLGSMEKALGQKAKDIAQTIQTAQQEIAAARG